MAAPLTAGLTYTATAGGTAAGGALGALGAAAGPLGAVIGLAPLLIHPKRNGMKMMNGLKSLGSGLQQGIFDLARPFSGRDGQMDYDKPGSFLHNPVIQQMGQQTQQQRQEQQRRQEEKKRQMEQQQLGWGLDGAPSAFGSAMGLGSLLHRPSAQSLWDYPATTPFNNMSLPRLRGATDKMDFMEALHDSANRYQ